MATAGLPLFLMFMIVNQCCNKDVQGLSWRFKEATGTFGQTVRLPCKSTTSPTFQNKTNQPITGSAKYKIKEGRGSQIYLLVIRNLQQEDQGTYYCVAGEYRDAMILNLRVFIPPPKPNYDVIIATKGIVPVVVHGAPRPFLVQWDKKIGGSYRKIVKLEDNVLSGPQAMNGRMTIDPDKGYLIIKNVMASDTGEYRIQAETDFQAFEKTTNITAQDVDECETRSHNCALRGANCTNTIGSFVCKCNSGFTGNGTTCTDEQNGFLNGNKFFTKERQFPVLYCVTKTPFTAFYAQPPMYGSSYNPTPRTSNSRRRRSGSRRITSRRRTSQSRRRASTSRQIPPNSRRIIPSGKYIVRDLGKDFFGYTTSLKIITVTREDEMNLICVANGGVRVKTMLKVLENPKPKSRYAHPIPSFRNEESTCRVGEYCRLLCDTSSKTNTSLYKSDSKVSSSNRTRIVVHSAQITLYIDPLKESDAGPYLCKDGGKVALTNLHVRNKVLYDHENNVFTLKVGTRGEIGVTVEGRSAQRPERIRWYYNAVGKKVNLFGSYGDLLASRWGRFYGAKSDKFEVSDHGSLIIKNVQPSDAGTYVITYTLSGGGIGGGSATAIVQVE